MIKNKNAIFFELGGTAMKYSLNYERILLQHGQFKLSFRVGAEYLRDLWQENNKEVRYPYIVTPSEINFMVGRKHYFETGFGYSPSFGKRKYFIPDPNYFPPPHGTRPDIQKTYRYDYVLVPKIGYRYQTINGGFFFKANINLIIFTQSRDPYGSYYSGIDANVVLPVPQAWTGNYVPDPDKYIFSFGFAIGFSF